MEVIGCGERPMADVLECYFSLILQSFLIKCKLQKKEGHNRSQFSKNNRIPQWVECRTQDANIIDLYPKEIRLPVRVKKTLEVLKEAIQLYPKQ